MKENRLFVSTFHAKEVISSHLKFLKQDMGTLSAIRHSQDRIKYLIQDVKLEICLLKNKQSNAIEIVKREECKICEIKVRVNTHPYEV